MYRPIKGTNERYIINEEGIVIDTQPYYMEHMEWQWESIDPTQPREVQVTDGYVHCIKSNGKQTMYSISKILRETFPELYQITDESKQRIINSFNNEKQDTYTISLKDFNKMIYPNELIKIYDTTANNDKNIKWKKPTVINPNARGFIVLHKGRKYFGLGTRNIIHFNANGLPYNAKPWAEPISTTYTQMQEAI